MKSIRLEAVIIPEWHEDLNSTHSRKKRDYGNIKTRKSGSRLADGEGSWGRLHLGEGMHTNGGKKGQSILRSGGNG